MPEKAFLNLNGVARTLLVPLACRALESPRPDAILHDPRAVEVYNALGGNPDFLMGMRGTDVFVATMRARQFDTFANRISSVLKRSGTRILWNAKNSQELETWGLHLPDHWYYFDQPEPRLRAFRWMRFIPFMAKATGIFHYRLG